MAATTDWQNKNGTRLMAQCFPTCIMMRVHLGEKTTSFETLRSIASFLDKVKVNLYKVLAIKTRALAARLHFIPPAAPPFRIWGHTTTSMSPEVADAMQCVRSNMAASEATSAVFGIVELLENILINLQPRDLLRCYSVSKTFHATIEGSKQLKRTLFWEVDYLPSGPAPFSIFFKLPRRALAGGKEHLLHQKKVGFELSGTLICEFNLPRSKIGATFNWTNGRKPTLTIFLDDVWNMFNLEEDAMSSFGRCSLTDPAERMIIDLTFRCPSIGFISSAKDQCSSHSWKRLLQRSRSTTDYVVHRKVRARVDTSAMTMRQAIDICRALILLHSEYGDINVPGLTRKTILVDESQQDWRTFDHEPAEWRGNSELHTRVADLLLGPISFKSALQIGVQNPGGQI